MEDIDSERDGAAGDVRPGSRHFGFHWSVAPSGGLSGRGPGPGRRMRAPLTAHYRCNGQRKACR